MKMEQQLYILAHIILIYDRFWLADATTKTHPRLYRDLVAVGVDVPLKNVRLADLIARNTRVLG